MELTIAPAGDGDAGELLTVQRAAYVTEAQIYREAHLPALTETLNDLRAVLAGTTLVLVARHGHRAVGVVRARVAGGACHIGRLAVAPDLQGRGIGTRLIGEVERRHRGRVARFTIHTGHLSEANLRLYTRLGYVEVDRRALTVAVTEVHLAKDADLRD
jgi:ribosomal protein S18 acetylase RimI-like enzyme